MTFTPFRHLAGDLYQRIGGSNGFHWRELSRSVAWGHVIDLLSEAEHASSLGDSIHAVRLAKDANCLLSAIGEHDEWRKAAAAYVPANDIQLRERA